MKPFLFRLTPVLLFLFSLPIFSDAFYFPWEYNKLYNENATLRIELDSLRLRYRNETDNAKKEKLSLDARIQNLEEQLAGEKSFREKDRELAAELIRALENQIALLKTKSGNKEKELIEENEKQSKKYQDLISELKSELEKERLNCIRKMDELKREYESKIASLEARIKELEDNLSKLKNLNEDQKRELNRLAEQANELESKLSGEIAKGQIRVKRFHNRLVINIDDQISFDSGSAELKKQIFPALDKIKEILVKYPGNLIIVEGHTDNIPIRNKKFNDNWQLSTERALSVVRFLLESKNLDARNFSVAGYGEHQPIVSNETPENRSLNRRVDIVLEPQSGKSH
ncbi:OmpA/MotB family protein [Leptospira andrefontaineae]|uniref:Endoflagellar motor protein n=1 Tax=Leptospira andrefontaineae TaxID=2484976 RepID=A0A4R9H2X0_9LEPT|nr:OmpA family protein [Leptospira andrefontaineae]TGK39026.1 endoflagellar motor protein [Leptospira andrefontaineae]